MKPGDRPQWFRHPAIAILAGLAVGGGILLAGPILFRDVGDEAIIWKLLFVFLIQTLPWFIIGLVAGRRGFLWAGAAGCLTIVGVIGAEAVRNRWDFGIGRALLLLVIGVLAFLATGLLGRLGEMASKLPARTLVWIGCLSVAAASMAVAAIWWSQASSLAHFERTDAVAIERLVSEKVAKLPASVRWDVRRIGYSLGVGGGYYINGKSRGLLIMMSADSSGDRVLGCYLRYRPEKSVTLADLPSAKRHLESLGFTGTLVDRLETGEEEAIAQTWFLLGDLSPRPRPERSVPYRKTVILDLASDGTISSRYGTR